MEKILSPGNFPFKLFGQSTNASSQGYGLSGKGVYCHIWEPEINPWDLRGWRREAAPAGCPLSTYQRRHKHTHRDTRAHKTNKGSNKNTLLYVVWVKLVGTATIITCMAELQRAENINCCVEQRTEISLAKGAKCESRLEPECWMLNAGVCFLYRD